MVSVRRVGFQAECLRNVEFRWNGLVCRRDRFGCTDFRSADTDRPAVVDAGAAVADVAVADVATGAVVVAAGLSRDDLRDNLLDPIASTFFVVSYRKTIQSDLKSFALSE